MEDSLRPAVVGVDPGLSGAVVFYSPDEQPVLQLRIYRDFKALPDIASALRDVGAEARLFEATHATPGSTKGFVEYVHAMPGQGVSSMFNFGKATGVAIGSLFFNQTDVVEVAPQRWQNWVKKHVGIFEGAHLLAATDLFKPRFDEFDARIYAVSAFGPDWVQFFKRGKDHGSADAALIALYGAWLNDEAELDRRLRERWREVSTP